MQIKPGDLFYTSWGYDQTNYDFIIVLAISKTGKTARCQRAGIETLGNSHGCDIQKPVNFGFGDVFNMRIQKCTWRDDESMYLRGSYPYCHTGEGSRRLDTFSKVAGHEVFYETDAYHGH